jgi:hypothetical protein
VAIIVGVVAWFVVRHQRARSVPSTAYTNGQGDEMMWQPAPYPLSIETPRIYDPSDPATYPRNVYHPVSNKSSTRHLQPNDAGYSGLPEI